MKLWKKILFPPIWMLVLLIFVSAAGLFAVSTRNVADHPIAYGIFTLATYTVTVLCIFMCKVVPKVYKKIRQDIYENPIGNRYMTDATFKVKVSLWSSLVINFTYSVFKLIMGIVYSSFWWGAIAVYYMILSLMRFLLLYYMERKQGEKSLLLEYRSYQLCGMLFFTINLSLSGIIFQMVKDSRGFEYPDTLILIVAMYTFYNVIVSIVEMVKYRRYKSPVLSASKAIRFAAALVSVLSLETAMLTVYGSDEAMYKTMTAWTGIGVCVVVLGMSIYMIMHAILEIKKLRQEI